MHVSEVTDKIKALPLFDKLVLSEPSEDSQHGTITVEPRHFKDGGKNEIKLMSILYQKLQNKAYNKPIASSQA